MNNAWKFQQDKYNPDILDKLPEFDDRQMSDPQTRKIWV